jgi:hypothetical protein
MTFHPHPQQHFITHYVVDRLLVPVVLDVVESSYEVSSEADCFLFVSHVGQIREPTANVNLTLPSKSGNVFSPLRIKWPQFGWTNFCTHCNSPSIQT